MKKETKDALIKLAAGAVIGKIAECGTKYAIDKLDRKKSNKINVKREEVVNNFKSTCNDLIKIIEDKDSSEETIRSNYTLYLETVTMAYERLQELNLKDNTSAGLRSGFYYQGIIRTLKENFDNRLYKVLVKLK